MIRDILVIGATFAGVAYVTDSVTVGIALALVVFLCVVAAREIRESPKQKTGSGQRDGREVTKDKVEQRKKEAKANDYHHKAARTVKQFGQKWKYEEGDLLITYDHENRKRGSGEGVRIEEAGKTVYEDELRRRRRTSRSQEILSYIPGKWEDTIDSLAKKAVQHEMEKIKSRKEKEEERERERFGL
jgi:hypothetical protein